VDLLQSEMRNRRWRVNLFKAKSSRRGKWVNSLQTKLRRRKRRTDLNQS
jgi:hypothetical protein